MNENNKKMVFRGRCINFDEDAQNFGKERAFDDLVKHISLYKYDCPISYFGNRVDENHWQTMASVVLLDEEYYTELLWGYNKYKEIQNVIKS